MLVPKSLPLSEFSRESNSLGYLHILLPTPCMQVYEPIDYLHLIGLDPLEAGRSDQYIVTGIYLTLLITCPLELMNHVMIFSLNTCIRVIRKVPQKRDETVGFILL